MADVLTPTAAFARLRVWRPGAYAVVAGVFLVVMSAIALNNNIISDFAQHASAIERIKTDPWHPSNPLLDLPGDNSPYFSPLIVALGLLARVTGLAGWQVLKAWGPVNLLLFLTGVHAFAKQLSDRRWVPLLALGAVMLLWGVRPAAWSGFVNVQGLTRNLTFPATFAIALTLHLWALTARAARERMSLTGHAGMGALAALILLCHPITSIGAAAGVAAIVIGWQRDWSRAVVARWALTGAVALAVVLAWPYYDVFSLAGDTTVDSFHRKLYGLRIITWYSLSLVGVPALVMRWRRHRLDPLVLLYAADCLIAAYGWVSGRYTYGRIFGMLLMPAQFALAVELARPRPWSALRRRFAQAAAGAACVGMIVQAGVFIPASLSPVPLQRLARWPSYRWAADRIPVGDVVLTDDNIVKHVLPAYGPFLVLGAWPDPSVSASVRHRRAMDVDAYFSPRATARQQERIVRRYHVRWVLLQPGQRLPAGARPVASGPETGETLARLAD